MSLLSKEAVIITTNSQYQTFTITDPRHYDGDPFEVAERAARQAEAMAAVLDKCLRDARVMARNAQAERDLLTTGECDMPGYEDTAEARRFDSLLDRVSGVQKDLQILSRAVSFNPRRPLNAGS